MWWPWNPVTYEAESEGPPLSLNHQGYVERPCLRRVRGGRLEANGEWGTHGPAVEVLTGQGLGPEFQTPAST